MGYKEDLENPNLFTENAPGEYEYSSTPYGKSASGQLCLTDNPQRDAAAQRSAGGESRRTAGNEYGVDDGGHLIGARFGGAAGEENLTAQDRNLNRSQYKNIENSWAERLEAGDKVYVNMESYDHDGEERPTNYMGYAIIEHTDEEGNVTREVEFYDLNNESRAEQDAWNEEEESYFADNPDVVEEQRSENTQMQYIWNEEKGELEENPYYQPEETYTPSEENTAEVETASDYAPEAGEETAAESTVSNDYAPESTGSEETVSSGQTSDYTVSSGGGYSSDSGGSGQDNSGQEM